MTTIDAPRHAQAERLAVGDGGLTELSRGCLGHPGGLRHATRVVRAIVARARRGGLLDAEDLVQEGLAAVVAADRDFDPARGVPFDAYARWRAHLAVRDALRSADPLPQRVRADLAAVRAAQARCLARGDADPSTAALAAEAGLPSARVARALAAEARSRLIDASMLDAVPDPGCAPGPEDLAVDADTRDRVRRALLDMPARERLVLVMRHCDGLPNQAVAAALGVSPGRASQLCSRAAARLRSALDQDRP